MSVNQLDLIDDWERKLIENLPNYDFIAWSDEEAFNRYQKHNFVYDKLIFGKQHTNIPTYDLSQSELPEKYPVVIKPRVNFLGMSKGTYIASSEEEIEDYTGYVAQQLLVGKHYSTECTVINGKVIDSYTYLCHKNFYNSFILFESVNTMDRFYYLQVINKIEEVLKGYTGPICIEHISGNIIDFHLRPGLQYYDLLRDMMSQYPDLVKGSYIPTKYKKTYSIVYRTRYNSRIRIKQIPNNNIIGISSVQLCFTHNQPLKDEIQDEFSYRYLVINGFDLNIIRNHGKFIKNHCLSFERI